MRYRSPDHRCSPHRDGNANRLRFWCRLPPHGSPLFFCFFCASDCGKSIQRGVAIELPGIEPRRRKIRTVWRIGIDLWLQAERVILAMDAVILAGHGSIEEIAGIELNARLVGPEFENTARSRIFQASGKAWRAGNASGEAEIVIIPLPDMNLLIRVAQPCAAA